MGNSVNIDNVDIEKSYKIRFNTELKDIVLINSIVDSYESLAMIRTDSLYDNNCIMMTTSSMKDTLLEVLESLRLDGFLIENLTITESDNIDFD